MISVGSVKPVRGVGAATLAASLPIPIEIAGPASADRVALGAGNAKKPARKKDGQVRIFLFCGVYIISQPVAVD